MAWLDAKPCASAVVVSGDRVLLVRRARDPWRDRWDVPGGFCNLGEHPITTARREVLEETGVAVTVVGFLGIWLDEYTEREDVPKRTLNIYYNAVPVGDGGIVCEPTEVSEARFFSSAMVPGQLAFPGHVPAALEAWRRAVTEGRLVTALFDAPVLDHSHWGGTP